MIFIGQLKIRHRDPRLGKSPNTAPFKTLESGNMLCVLSAFCQLDTAGVII